MCCYTTQKIHSMVASLERGVLTEGNIRDQSFGKGCGAVQPPFHALGEGNRGVNFRRRCAVLQPWPFHALVEGMEVNFSKGWVTLHCFTIMTISCALPAVQDWPWKPLRLAGHAVLGTGNESEENDPKTGVWKWLSTFVGSKRCTCRLNMFHVLVVRKWLKSAVFGNDSPAAVEGTEGLALGISVSQGSGDQW